MRVRIGCVFLLFSLTLPLSGQQSYSVEQVLFLPPEHYVGDLVEARVTVRVDEGVEVEPPEALPSRERVVIHDVRIKEQNGMKRIHITFSSFTVGVQTMPPLRLGDIELQDITFQTNSIIQEAGEQGEEAFREIREQVLLPGTTLLLLAVAACGVFVLLLLFPGLRLLRRMVRKILLQTGDRRRMALFFRRIEKLRNTVGSTDADSFYSALSSELKLYLSLRLEEDFSTKTTAELKPLLEVRFKGLYSDDRTKKESLPAKEIGELFAYGDKVRFGGCPAAVEKRLEHLSLIDETVHEIEKVRREGVEL